MKKKILQKKNEETHIITICNNYRGISLLDITYKILAITLKNRLEKLTENSIGDYQCGFRSNRSNIDQVFIIKQIQDNSYEHNLPLHIMFIDFKQAYDSVKDIKCMK